MSARPIRSALLSLILLVPLPRLSEAADPLPAVTDPAAPAAPLEYRSVFEGYRRSGPANVADWRRSNDTVRDVGGFAGSLKEAPGDTPPGDTGAAPGKTGDHGGHSK